MASPVFNALDAIMVRVPAFTTSEVMVQFCCGSVTGAANPVSLQSKALRVVALCTPTTSVPFVMELALKPNANHRPAGPVRVSVTCVPTSILAVIASPAVALKLTIPVVYVCALVVENMNRRKKLVKNCSIFIAIIFYQKEHLFRDSDVNEADLQLFCPVDHAHQDVLLRARVA